MANQGATAAATDWTYTSGDPSWFVPGNWSAGVPTAADDATIGNTRTASIDGTTTATTGNLFISNGGVTVGVNQPSMLNVSNAIHVGRVGNASRLTFNAGVISATRSYLDRKAPTPTQVAAR